MCAARMGIHGHGCFSFRVQGFYRVNSRGLRGCVTFLESNLIYSSNPLLSSFFFFLMTTSAPAFGSGTDDEGNSQFDCNICLEASTDPVITLCGHLFW